MWRHILAILTILGGTTAGHAAEDRYGDPLPDAAVSRLGTTRLRHAGGYYPNVAAAVFSPDGKRIVSTSDRTIRLWDATTGKALPDLTQERWVTRVAFGPDADSLVILSHGGTAELLHLTDKKKRLTLTEAWPCAAIAVSADGKRVAISHKKGISVVELPSGKVVSECVGGRASLTRLVLSPDGRVVAAGDGDLAVWDATTGQPRCEITCGQGPFGFSADGKFLVGTHPRKGFGVWDSASGALVRQFGQDKVWGTRALALSSDGKVLACNLVHYRDNKTIGLYDPTSGNELPGIDTGDAYQSGLVFAPDGKTLLALHNNMSIRLWDVTTRQEKLFAASHGGHIVTVAFSPDGKQIASGSRDGTLRFWEAASGKEQHRIGMRGESRREVTVSSVAYAPDGALLVAGLSQDHVAHAWDPKTGAEVKLNVGMHSRQVVYRDQSTAVWRVQFSPDGKLLLTEGRDDKSRLWDVQAGKELRVWHSRGESKRFTPDGKELMGLTSNGVEFFELLSGKSLRAIAPVEAMRRHKSPIVSPDARVAFAHRDATHYGLWELASGKQLAALDLDSNYVMNLVFAPDSKTVAAACLDGAVLLLDASTGKQLSKAVAHTGAVRVLAFSRDGRWLASGSDDTSIVVWDTNALRGA